MLSLPKDPGELRSYKLYDPNIYIAFQALYPGKYVLSSKYITVKGKVYIPYVNNIMVFNFQSSVIQFYVLGLRCTTYIVYLIYSPQQISKEGIIISIYR